MKVVIFCGGRGTRLNRETEFKPKPLVKVGGMPLLWHIMKIYSHFGHKEFILPLGYKGDMIKRFFIESRWRANDFTIDSLKQKIKIHKDSFNEDWIIHFIETGLESKTALRLHKVKHLLKDDEDFFVTYCDGVADVDLNALVDLHKNHRAVITLTGINQPSRFGIIKEKDSKIEEFQEKPISDNFINGGFMVMNRRIFEYLSDSRDEMLVEKILPQLAKEGKISVYKHKGFWRCMDTYRDYLELNKIWEKSAPWKIWS